MTGVTEYVTPGAHVLHNLTTDLSTYLQRLVEVEVGQQDLKTEKIYVYMRIYNQYQNSIACSCLL